MNVSMKIPASLNRFLGVLGPAGRLQLFSVAANALQILVRSHIIRQAPRRHVTAANLGARPTGFLEQAARKTVFNAGSDRAEVVIPSPGFSRAFSDVTILPKNARSLTLPLHAQAYGRRVSELRALGWNVFRPKGKDVLMGERDGQSVPLYALKKSVTQRQDRSLLPSDSELASTASRAMMAELTRISRKAG